MVALYMERMKRLLYCGGHVSLEDRGGKGRDRTGYTYSPLWSVLTSECSPGKALWIVVVRVTRDASMLPTTESLA